MDNYSDGLVSVIIPVWNGRHELPSCMHALDLQSGVEFEIIAVDNASEDGSADYIAAHFPYVRLLRNRTNLGFAGGCNVGLRHAHGSILVLLNQDTEAQSDWLLQLIKPLRQDSSIGIAGSKALFGDGTIQHAGAHLDHQAISHHYGHAGQDRHEYGQLRDVDFVTGAALAISRNAYEAIGDLDEGFSPAYYEDTDWCYRVRAAGYRVVYVADSVIVHSETSSLLDQGHNGLFILHRNRLRFVFKHWTMDKLHDEFLPAEKRWLNGLGWKGERIVAAMHHAYLYHLLHLVHVADARQQQFGPLGDEIDRLTELLLSLRSVYPLRPANLHNIDPESDISSPLGRPTSYWSSLVESIRRRWPHLSTAGIARRMARLNNQQYLAEVLIEYICENNREIAELAQEVQALREQLEQQSPSQPAKGKDR